jgi:hypothetical protein
MPASKIRGLVPLVVGFVVIVLLTCATFRWSASSLVTKVVFTGLLRFNHEDVL